MDTKRGKWRDGGGGGVMNWAIGIDMYTMMFIKLMTDKNLLYKKLDKIKFKKIVIPVFSTSIVSPKSAVSVLLLF